MNNQVESDLLLCLAYYNHKEVADYLEKILVTQCIRVIVIDNTPGRKTANSANSSWLTGNCLAAYKEGKLIIVGDGINRGYFGGFRYGLHYIKKQNFGYARWTILSNTDLNIDSPDWLQTLHSLTDNDIAVVAPKIISECSGKNQNPLYRSRPSAKKFLWLSRIFHFGLTTALHRLSALSKGRLRSKFRERDDLDKATIYAPHGSFICLSRNYFVRGGKLECPTFLYCEEIFLAEEVKSLGMKIVYTPQIVVRHREHGSTSFIPAPNIRKHLADAHRMAYDILSK